LQAKKRIAWGGCEKGEKKRYPRDKIKLKDSIAKIKLDYFIKYQYDEIKNIIISEYKDLRVFPEWIDKGKRKNFTACQTEAFNPIEKRKRKTRKSKDEAAKMYPDVFQKIRTKTVELWGKKGAIKQLRHYRNIEKNREGLVIPKRAKPHKILPPKVIHKFKEIDFNLLYELFDMVKEELNNNIDNHIGKPTEPFLINNIKYFDYERWLLERNDILKDYAPQVKRRSRLKVINEQPHNENTMDILELGAGNGWLSFLLRNVYHHNVIATDCSPLSLRDGESESDFFNKIKQAISSGPCQNYNWICDTICGGVLKIPLRYLRINRQQQIQPLETKFDLIIATHYTAYHDFTDEDWVFLFKDLVENHLKSNGMIVLQPITGVDPEFWEREGENTTNWFKLGEKIDSVIQSKWISDTIHSGVLIVKRN